MLVEFGLQPAPGRFFQVRFPDQAIRSGDGLVVPLVTDGRYALRHRAGLRLLDPVHHRDEAVEQTVSLHPLQRGSQFLPAVKYLVEMGSIRYLVESIRVWSRWGP